MHDHVDINYYYLCNKKKLCDLNLSKQFLLCFYFSTIFFFELSKIQQIIECKIVPNKQINYLMYVFVVQHILLYILTYHLEQCSRPSQTPYLKYRL